MDNRRRYSRVTVPLQATLRTGSGEVITGTLRDIAIQGAFVNCRPSIGLGSRAAITITLHGGMDDVRVNAQAEVVRYEDGGLGLRFTETDLDSVSHLRSIITFNAEDPDIIWEELKGGLNLRSEPHEP